MFRGRELGERLAPTYNGQLPRRVGKFCDIDGEPRLAPLASPQRWAAGRPQTTVTLPHSGESHFNVCWTTPRMPKFGSGRSSTRTSRPFPQQTQVGRFSWADSLADRARRRQTGPMLLTPSESI